MSPNSPNILCFSKHHIKKSELHQINVHGYSLRDAYCRQVVKRGGVCKFAQNNLRIQILIWINIVKIKTLKCVC